MTHTNITINGVEYAPVEDKFKDLKKAYYEGAVIEHRNNADEHRWRLSCGNKPDWTAPMYRIKDDISIESWKAHQDLIKQFWDGEEIECKQYNGQMPWGKCNSNPQWRSDLEYRVKLDEWKLPEYEDGSEFVVHNYGEIITVKSSGYTKAGRRRATKELAERCAEASKIRDLLEAWRDYLEPDYVATDWNNIHINKYYIYMIDGKYFVGYAFNTKSLGTVYMGETTAHKICDALNNGDISLED